MLEKLLLKRMSTFATKHKTLSPNQQIGFRKHYYFTNAITEITEYKKQEIDKRNRGYLCFIDLKKAFDTIDDEVPLAKLELYGFCGPIFHLSKTIYTNAISMSFIRVKLLHYQQ